MLIQFKYMNISISFKVYKLKKLKQGKDSFEARNKNIPPWMNNIKDVIDVRGTTTKLKIIDQENPYILLKKKK